MPPLRVEVYIEEAETWRTTITLNPGDPYGSISDNTERGRDVYYFGIDVIEGKAVINKSDFGVDIEQGRSREIRNLGGTSLVASLEPGEEYELTVKTDVSPVPRKLRFTHLDE